MSASINSFLSKSAGSLSGAQAVALYEAAQAERMQAELDYDYDPDFVEFPRGEFPF